MTKKPSMIKTLRTKSEQERLLNDFYKERNGNTLFFRHRFVSKIDSSNGLYDDVPRLISNKVFDIHESDEIIKETMLPKKQKVLDLRT